MNEEDSRSGFIVRNPTVVLNSAFTLAIISGLIWLGQVVQRLETLEQRFERAELTARESTAIVNAQSIALATINTQYSEIIRRLNRIEEDKNVPARKH